MLFKLWLQILEDDFKLGNLYGSLLKLVEAAHQPVPLVAELFTLGVQLVQIQLEHIQVRFGSGVDLSLEACFESDGLLLCRYVNFLA